MKNKIRTFEITFRQKMNNLSLSRKIMLLVLMTLAVTTIASGIGFEMLFRSESHMLYESLAGSLSASAATVSETLDNIESMTGILLADSNTQDNLAVVADSDDDSERNTAYRVLSYLIPEYYQNFKQYGIRFINLYNSSYTNYSDIAKSNDVPEEIQQEVIEAAHTNSGAAVWVTSYCNEYGLFLGRDVRRAEGLKLDVLGTILVCVDLDEIISSATKNVYLSGTAGFVLIENEAEIYHSETLDEQDYSRLLEKADHTYGVTRLSGQPFFYVKGTISDYGWEYICLISSAELQSAQQTYLLLSLLPVLIVILVTLLVSHTIIRSITQHFQTLVQKMEAFGKDDSVMPTCEYDYSTRTDEVGELHQRFDQMAMRIQELIQQKYVAELLSKEAQLKALESQINPHFLYNTLESLNWNAKAIGATDISTMVEALGSLLRVTLSNKETTSTVGRELKIVEDYMTIIRIRFEDRILYENQIPEELNSVVLPQLTLQPLVENAVNYALEEMSDTCVIRIAGAIGGSRIRICVVNSGSQFPPHLLEDLTENRMQPHGFGIGLLNIQKRLQLRFGSEYGLTIYNQDEDHAVVQIDIPIETHREEE
ncbi:MAG: sensor histidine kinase [Lachnospiraceae bacterium]|nr:sensor histidine kinase [Lachnospiraceae bacterium]